MAGAGLSRRIRTISRPSVHNHILHRCSGLVLVFCLCHVGLKYVLAMSVLPERDNAEGLLMPLRGMNTFGPAPLREMSSFGLAALLWYSAPARVVLLRRGAPARAALFYYSHSKVPQLASGKMTL